MKWESLARLSRSAQEVTIGWGNGGWKQPQRDEKAQGHLSLGSIKTAPIVFREKLSRSISAAAVAAARLGRLETY